MNPHSDCTPTRSQRRAAYQAQRCADPVLRSLEQSSDTEQRAIARTNPVVRSLEQSADTEQQAVCVCFGLQLVVSYCQA